MDNDQESNWRRLVHGLSAWSVAAFVISAMLHGITFGQIGLDYLQIASPADVFMDGLDLVLRSVIMIVPATIGFFAGIAAGSSGRIHSLLAMAGALVSASLAVYALFTPDIRSTVPLFSIFTAALLAGIPWGAHFQGKVSLREDTAPVATGLALAVVLAITMAIALTSTPYWRPGWKLSDAPPSCVGAEVVWTGDNALVLRCPGEVGRYGVVFNPENKSTARSSQ